MLRNQTIRKTERDGKMKEEGMRRQAKVNGESNKKGQNDRCMDERGMRNRQRDEV